MNEQQYAAYDCNTGNLVGVSSGKEMTEAVVETGIRLGKPVRIESITGKEAERLRAEQHKEIMGNFPQDILGRR